MTSTRWQEIKRLVDTALPLEAEARTEALRRSGVSDAKVLAGVTALITLHEQTTSSLPDAPPTGGFTTQLMSQINLPDARWREVERLFQSALERTPDERAAFLAAACGQDQALRQEVESLLVYQAAAGENIQAMIDEAAGLLANAPSGLLPRARFAAGTLLAGRYRIVGLLGQGGMGEVYRADDLKLGQSVALKFLSPQLSHDKAMLTRFLGEVRTARQVSHPNVCRVHDIGEITTATGTQHFLSMEYVDGEDLSSLLRRIGRVPADKAGEIAAQLCAGLAAAHDAGVLHRDLKPANVMIDGRGKVRITDFGLAALAGQIRGREALVGTPAYMAPEQLAGQEVTSKSDIYALGLVLYELFTGKRVFNAGSLDELRRAHEHSAPTNPSSWVKDLDPLVERVILRCLEKDPELRPASAIQVAAALPGGDPLAAALAAGETPSPEMVAATPKAGALRPVVAIACFLCVLLTMVFLVAFSNRIKLHNYLPLTKSPEVMNERARDVIAQLGYNAGANFSRYSFAYDHFYYRRAAAHGQWEKLHSGRLPMIYFWYTQSPRYLEQVDSQNDSPPALTLDVAGMTEVSLDPRGRLIEFIRVPQQIDAQPATTAQPDWAKLFAAADLAPANFKTTVSQWTPPVAYDARTAWEGALPEHPEIPIRIEAAGYHSLPVYFQIVYPWSTPLRQESVVASRKNWAGGMLLTIVAAAVCLMAAWLTRRNLRAGRGDRSGAFKLAVFVFVLRFAGRLFSAAHTSALAEEAAIFFAALETALLYAGLFWVIYIALEPYVRRYWPRLLISWSRLMAGDFRDPMVGRDILLGGLLGLFHTVGIYIQQLMPAAINGNFQPNNGTMLGALRGFHLTLAMIPLTITGEVISSALFTLFLLLLFYILLRREWLAALTLGALVVVILSLLFAYSWWSVPGIMMIATSLIYTNFRFGLLAGMSWQFFFSLTFHYPLTADFSIWHASISLFCLLVLIILAAFGCYTAIGGQKVLRHKLFED